MNKYFVVVKNTTQLKNKLQKEVDTFLREEIDRIYIEGYDLEKVAQDIRTRVSQLNTKHNRCIGVAISDNISGVFASKSRDKRVSLNAGQWTIKFYAHKNNE